MNLDSLKQGQEVQYNELLDNSPTEAVLMLDDPNVEVNSYNNTISIPERYADTGIDSLINRPLGTVKRGAEEQVQDVYRRVQEADFLPANPAYQFGRENSTATMDDPDDEEVRFDIWDAEDDHRKSAYGTATGLVGTGAAAASISDEAAVAFGAATTGVAAFNSYSRGRRDEMLEEAVSGLSTAYGDYSIELKEDERRSEKVREKVSWVKETLTDLK